MISVRGAGVADVIAVMKGLSEQVICVMHVVAVVLNFTVSFHQKKRHEIKYLPLISQVPENGDMNGI